MDVFLQSCVTNLSPSFRHHTYHIELGGRVRVPQYPSPSLEPFEARVRAWAGLPEYHLTLSPASRLYRLNSGRLLAMSFWGTDKSTPEFQRVPAEPQDPSRSGAYCLGNLIRRD